MRRGSRSDELVIGVFDGTIKLSLTITNLLHAIPSSEARSTQSRKSLFWFSITSRYEVTPKLSMHNEYSPVGSKWIHEIKHNHPQIVIGVTAVTPKRETTNKLRPYQRHSRITPSDQVAYYRKIKKQHKELGSDKVTP